MSPTQGVNAARAFLGFATEFGVREGNAELVAGIIPHGYGEGVRDMAVSVARGVNLSRMGRIALMPLFKGLVATPLQWAINQQYRPELLGPAEAVWAYFLDYLTIDQLQTELQYHGYSDGKISALTYMSSERINAGQLHHLYAAKQFSDTDLQLELKKRKWGDPAYLQLLAAMDILPARDICLATAKKAVTAYVEGTGTLESVQDFLVPSPISPTAR